MSDNELQRAMIEQFGIRIQTQMAQYVQAHLLPAQTDAQIHVIGGDSRTGVSVRKLIALESLRRPAARESLF